MQINIDIETRSAVDLAKAGVHIYAAHPTTQLINFAYSINDGPETLWRPGMAPPLELELAILAGAELHAWNAQFERVMWPVVQRACALPSVALEQWRCTMVRAYLQGFPGSLKAAGPSMGLDVSKSEEGHRLMMRVSKPRQVFKPGKAPEQALAQLNQPDPLPEFTEHEGIIYQWWVDEERMAGMGEYVKQDVAAERAAGRFLDPIPEGELAGWRMDQRINDRGFLVDMELVRTLQKLVPPATAAANARLSQLTGGQIAHVTKPNDIRAWLNEKLGLTLASIDKDNLTILKAEHDMPPAVREVIDLRLSAGKTSVAKLNALVKGTGDDCVLRGGLQYAGAGRTNRYAGRRFQPHNLPRPEKWALEALPYLQQGRVGEIELLWGSALEAISSALRSCITAREGRRLVVADYNAIEARVIAWIAGASTFLNAFRNGDDPYRIMAAVVFGISDWRTIPKDDDMRALGKAIVLGCGFQMGDKRFYESCREKGMFIERALATKSVEAYRSANPEIPTFWRNIEAAAIQATDSPYSWVAVDETYRIAFYHDGSFLRMRLPSGRLLSYLNARTYADVTPWGAPCTKLEFWGWNGQRNRMEWQGLYGGRLTENAVQAIARDILTGAMIRLDAQGWQLILSVHDEVLADESDPTHGARQLEKEMARGETWSEGLPLEVEGWEGPRYKK